MIISAAFSAIIIVGAFVFPETRVGIIDASTTLTPLIPCTLRRSLTTLGLGRGAVVACFGQMQQLVHPFDYGLAGVDGNDEANTANYPLCEGPQFTSLKLSSEDHTMCKLDTCGHLQMDMRTSTSNKRIPLLLKLPLL